MTPTTLASVEATNDATTLIRLLNHSWSFDTRTNKKTTMLRAAANPTSCHAADKITANPAPHAA